MPKNTYHGLRPDLSENELSIEGQIEVLFEMLSKPEDMVRSIKEILNFWIDKTE